jgi:hypothetical protein
MDWNSLDCFVRVCDFFTIEPKHQDTSRPSGELFFSLTDAVDGIRGIGSGASTRNISQ